MLVIRQGYLVSRTWTNWGATDVSDFVFAQAYIVEGSTSSICNLNVAWTSTLIIQVYQVSRFWNATFKKEWRNEHRLTAGSTSALLLPSPPDFGPSSLPVPSCVGFMHRASRAGPLPQCLTNTKKPERLESVQVKKDSMWDPRSFYMADWRTYYAFKLSILNWYLIPILHNTNG
jgi:hypothetical protein